MALTGDEEDMKREKKKQKNSGATSNKIKMGLLRSCNRICPSFCICFPLRVLGNVLWNRWMESRRAPARRSGYGNALFFRAERIFGGCWS